MGKQTLTLITWNLEFITNNWEERGEEIFKVLSQYSEADITAFQEVGIPGNVSKSVLSKYAKYTSKKIVFDPVVDRGKLLSLYIFRVLIDIIYKINCFIFNLLGHYADTLYEIRIFRIFYILLGTPLLFGLASMISNKCKILEKVRFSLGNYRVTQALHLQYNQQNLQQQNHQQQNNSNVDFWTINVHLSPDIKTKDTENKKKRETEVDRLLEFIDSKIGNADCFILGDWNCNPDDGIFKKIVNAGFVNCVQKKTGSNMNTFPTYKIPPKTIGNSDRYKNQCIDYIWYRGKHFTIDSCKKIGTEECSDHYGLLMSLSLQES